MNGDPMEADAVLRTADDDKRLDPPRPSCWACHHPEHEPMYGQARRRCEWRESGPGRHSAVEQCVCVA
jgi:hypothetical protein